MRKLLFATAATFALSVSLSIAAETDTWKTVGWWQIRVDHTAGDACFMVAAYGNTAFRVSLAPDLKSLHFLLANDEWKSLKAGQQYKLTMQFGGLEPHSGLATAHRWKDGNGVYLTFYLNDYQGVMKELASQPDVTFQYDDQLLGSFQLKDSEGALREVALCQVAQNTGDRDPFKTTNRKTDPFK